MTPFRLQLGDAAPRQQSPTTCGSASLTVARMLADPWFARWITLGLAREVDADAGPSAAVEVTASERFACYEQVVVGRTNALFGGGGRLQLPWPRALGTPPWGARHELELGIGAPGERFAVRPLRVGSPRSLEREFANLCSRVEPGRPALLYVGNRWLPRHVVLVLPATGASELDVYEPSAGRVVALRREAFVNRSLALGGWDVPWAAVWADRVVNAS
ncbi:hypothetical protein [Humibacillus sp. DSM 29435]|uniref:hypothetical protein n=1 Tax=Humibacillus sp. DSM 29435 TaxID=1869167 RepID=UPI000A5DF3D7|nr:hypothetical protein [Humibacillus sp. DSM 29435]